MRGRILTLAVTGVLAAGCGGPPCARTHRSVCLETDAGPGFESTVDAALAFWGADTAPSTVSIHRGPFPCLGFDDCEGVAEPAERTVTIDIDWDPGCPYLVLPHELGHILIDDPQHLDPRWKTLHMAAMCPRAGSAG